MKHISPDNKIDIARPAPPETILVLGATGTIGSAICQAFANNGYNIIAAARSERNLRSLHQKNPSLLSHHVDVVDAESCRRLMQKITELHGLIYSVGYCPPSGFSDSIAISMTKPEASERLQREFAMQLYGLQNIISHSLPVLKQGSKIIVINSALTRLPRLFHPQAMHDAYYLAAKKAQETFLKRIRQNDPGILEKKIKISIIYPAAISCDFHTNSNLLPPAFVPLEKVVTTVLKNYASRNRRDVFIWPSITTLRSRRK